jgi:hypothetical protein
MGIAVDFRRISRLGASTLALPADRTNSGSVPCYRRGCDNARVIMKSVWLSEQLEQCQIEREIVNLLTLSPPLIALPIGFVFPMASIGPQELKICPTLSHTVTINLCEF